MFNSKSEASIAMRLSGMSPREISEILNAHVAGHPEIKQDVMKIVNSKPFADMLERRQAYYKNQIAKGLGRLQILAKLNKLYAPRMNKVTPWDFLKVEYKPVKQVTGPEFDKMLASRKESQKQVEKLYGKMSNRPKAAPRFSPKVRKVPDK